MEEQNKQGFDVQANCGTGGSAVLGRVQANRSGKSTEHPRILDNYNILDQDAINRGDC